MSVCALAACPSQQATQVGIGGTVMGSQLPGQHTHTHKKKNSENETKYEREKKAICVKGESGLR